MRLVRRLSLAVVISLALNLLLGGLLATQWLLSDPASGKEHRARFARDAARAAVSEQYRPAIDAVWSARQKTLRKEFREMRTLRNQFRQLLLAEQLDKPALDTAYAELQRKSEATRASLMSAMSEIASSLPDAERKRYFEAGMPKRWDKRKQTP